MYVEMDDSDTTSYSTMMVEQLNLRHYSDISETDVGSLPAYLSHLWIGPSFGPQASVSAIVTSIPVHLQQLDMDLNRMSFDPIVCITLFQRLHKLTKLCLRFIGEEGASAVAQAIPHTQSLECLDIRGNRIGDAGLEAIVKAFIDTPKMSVRHIMLSWNNLTVKGVTALARYLEQDTCVLENLDLSCNTSIGDDSVHELCRALRTNTSLVELNLFCCPGISNAGAAAISECLEHHNTTLRSINLQACHKLSNDLIQQVQYWTALNGAGRRVLQDGTVADGLWADILARCYRSRHTSKRYSAASGTAFSDSDKVYFLIRQKMDLIGKGGSQPPAPSPPQR
jgi:Ran GTPase-activating protein (RanGAP) involved in mRNA processing and transport